MTRSLSLLEVRGLHHSYDRNLVVLRGLSFSVERGEFVSIVGANGSGKTTLIKHFNGLLKPTQGLVMVNGVDTKTASVAELSRTVGFVFQNPDHQIFSYSLWDEVMFGLRNHGLSKETAAERASEALRAVGLYDVRDRHPRTLSRGQRQRLATASVLAMETDILILDEPTTGQDYVGRRQLMDLARALHDRGKTILMVTHDMALVAEYSTRVIVMTSGTIVLDAPPRQTFADVSSLKAAGLRLPPMIDLAQQLGPLQSRRDATTIDELADGIAAAWSRVAGARGQAV